MHYRKLVKTDAERFWEMMNQLDHETKYMLYEPGERIKNIARIESLIENSVEGEDFLLVAEESEDKMWYLDATDFGVVITDGSTAGPEFSVCGTQILVDNKSDFFLGRLGEYDNPRKSESKS